LAKQSLAVCLPLFHAVGTPPRTEPCQLPPTHSDTYRLKPMPMMNASKGDTEGEG
jgi:hypothetical protein